MKIYTKVVINMDSMEVVEEESFDYLGPIAQCGVNIGGGSQKSTPEKVDVWTPEQRALFNALMPSIAEGLGYKVDKGQIYDYENMPAGVFSLNLGGGKYTLTPTGTGVPRYPGDLFAPTTPEELEYFGREGNFAEDLARLRVAMGEQRDRLATPAFNVTPETTEQYYQDVIRAPMMKDWREVVEPQIRESFAGPGYWGSARAQAQVEGAEDLTTTLGSERGKLYYADEQARREALEAAAAREAGFAPIMAQLDYLGTTEGAKFAEEVAKSRAEYSRQIEQERIAGELQRWLMGEEVGGVTPTQYNPFLQLAFQALGLSPYVVGTKTTGSSYGYGLGLNF